MKYKVRQIVPQLGHWKEIKAETPEEAANELHFQEEFGVIFWPNKDEAFIQKFAIVEVENNGRFISRIEKKFIGRRGGLFPPHIKTSLEEVAKNLGVKIEEIDIEEWEWNFKESWEEAAKRRK